MKKINSGVYINDTWEAFLAQRDGLSNWKIPLIIAMALHVVVFTGVAVFPDVSKKFELDSVVTIDLLSLPANELAGGSQASQQLKKLKKLKTVRQVVRKTVPTPAKMKGQRTTQAAVLPVVTPKKKIKVASRGTPKSTPKNIPTIVPEGVAEVVEKTVSTPQSVPEVTEVEPITRPVKQISLRPLKRKKKLAQDVRLAEVKEQEEKKRQEQLEQRAALEKEKKRLAVQKQKEAAEKAKKLAARKKKQEKAAARKRLVEQQRREREIAQAKRLAQQAEQAAEEAQLEAEQLRQEYTSVAQIASELKMPLTSGNPGRGGDGGSGGEQINPEVLNQYAASLKGRISSHWKLPEIVKKKSNLRTVIALTVRRNGTIKDMWIEQKSGDNFFDQSVKKALRSAEPLPRFPDLMDKSTLEFALNFTPQGLAF
ncbi:MAG: cell envelope integrity protein TolA [Candidatus Electrothrix sp. AW3_4]|nr:cell envelope integrity protein TolA [Candidatus Electrothrix gigas]